MGTLERTLAAIGCLDQRAMAGARERQHRLTKPRGSLGRLERLSIQLAGIQGQARPHIREKTIFVMAGDHGVVAEGVTPYPQVVTAQMLANFAAGGAAINVLARQIGARVVVADMGVAGDVSAGGRVLTRKIALGTDNIAKGPAMSAQHSHRSVEGGIEVFEEESGGKLDLVGTGDMGIGNTTPSAAVIAAFTGLAAQEVTGRGTGVDDAGLALKVATVERALTVNDPDPADALDVLAKLGGFEIGGLAGVMLAAAAHRAAVVIDGLISGAAALVAVGLEPKLKDFLIAGHLSTEPGHRAALAHLGLEPLLNLEMRLGEGTGAALAMAVVEAAARLLNEMATFEEAGVSEATEGPCGGC